MATPNPNQPPPPPPCVGSKLNPAYVIPLPKQAMVAPVKIPLWEVAKLDKYTGSRAASERLVRSIAAANPSRDGKWCADKALWDLQRDRH